MGDCVGWGRDVEYGGTERAYSGESVERVDREASGMLVKVGQAVAIRPDLLPPAYLEEFQTLLDQVEAFPSEDARKLIQKTIGENVRLEDVFEDVSCFDKPVAASIGQVYKATLKKGALKKSGEETEEYGRTVAVKVQRPDILKP